MPPQQIFVSYSRIDSDFVLKISTDLKVAGVHLWLDQLDIQAGATWDFEVEKALESCDCLIFIVSHDSVASNNVLNEVYFALEEKKRVLPVKIDGCKIPFRIKRLQYIDISINYDTGFKSLLKALNIKDREETFLVRPDNAFRASDNSITDKTDAAPSSVKNEKFGDITNRISEREVEEPVANINPFDDNYASSKRNKYSLRHFAIAGILALVIFAIIWVLLIKKDASGNTDSIVMGTTHPTSSGNENTFTKDPSGGSVINLYHDGMALYNQKAYSEAIEKFQEVVDSGNKSNFYYHTCAYYLGIIYQRGLGMADPNHAKAVDYYTKAASAGASDALIDLSLMLDSGFATARDTAKAHKLFEDFKKLQ